MTQAGLQEDASTAVLLREALEQAQMLIKTEIALAKDEIRGEMRGVKRAMVAFGLAAVLGVLGVVFLLIAFTIGTAPHVLPALIAGLALLAIAVTAGAIGGTSLPKKPLGETTRRVEGDLEVLKERIA